MLNLYGIFDGEHIVKTDNKLAKLTLKQDVINQEERAGTIRPCHPPPSLIAKITTEVDVKTLKGISQ